MFRRKSPPVDDVGYVALELSLTEVGRLILLAARTNPDATSSEPMKALIHKARSVTTITPSPGGQVTYTIPPLDICIRGGL